MLTGKQPVASQKVQISIEILTEVKTYLLEFASEYGDKSECPISLLTQAIENMPDYSRMMAKGNATSRLDRNARLHAFPCFTPPSPVIRFYNQQLVVSKTHTDMDFWNLPAGSCPGSANPGRG